MNVVYVTSCCLFGFQELDHMLTFSTAKGCGISFGTPACEGKSLQLVGMLTGCPPNEIREINPQLKLLISNSQHTYSTALDFAWEQTYRYYNMFEEMNDDKFYSALDLQFNRICCLFNILVLTVIVQWNTAVCSHTRSFIVRNWYCCEVRLHWCIVKPCTSGRS